MLALFRIEPSVRRTPNSFTPRFGHVRELCPLWLQCEHRLVIFAGDTPIRDSAGSFGLRSDYEGEREEECGIGLGFGERGFGKVGGELVVGDSQLAVLPPDCFRTVHVADFGSEYTEGK